LHSYAEPALKRHTFLCSSVAVTFLPTSARASALEDQLTRLATESSGTVGIYARKLGVTSPVTYNADLVFPAASVIKLVIFVALYQFAEHEPDVFARRITLQLSDFVGGSEILDGYNPGQSIAIVTLARAMIEQSDNTASNVLLDYLGFDRIRATIHQAGLAHTQLKRHFMDVNAIFHHSENLTTPRDMGMLLSQLERGAHEGLRTIASPASCRKMIDILLHQEDRDKIARGLPKGVPLADKTGEIDGVRNDVGIIDPYGETPYVLAVLTKDLNDFSLGNIAIRRIATAVHSALY